MKTRVGVEKVCVSLSDDVKKNESGLEPSFERVSGGDTSDVRSQGNGLEWLHSTEPARLARGARAVRLRSRRRVASQEDLFFLNVKISHIFQSQGQVNVRWEIRKYKLYCTALTEIFQMSVLYFLLLVLFTFQFYAFLFLLPTFVFNRV